MPAPLFVVGDVHGHRDALVRLLREAALVDGADAWRGRDARVWLVGDLVDRGPDGVGAVRLVRRLERESAGRLRCLLGNHEALILAARRFRVDDPRVGDSFHGLWKLNGGVDDDLRALTDEDAAWLAGLPPLARQDGWLLLHADTTAYLDLGRTIESAAAATRRVLTAGTPDELDHLLVVVSDRVRLLDPAAVDALLAAYGGARIVHGHTPIALLRGVEPHEVTGPLVYADGRVTNVDHCLFAGGPGFVTQLESGSGPPA